MKVVQNNNSINLLWDASHLYIFDLFILFTKTTLEKEGIVLI